MATTSTNPTVDIRREVKLCPTCQQRFSRDAVFCPFDGAKLLDGSFDPLADPLIGTRVDGRYDVLSVLGEGGMGRIYQVRHAALDRPFAMKVLRPELAREEELAARFILEAKATASVKHPNVVQITDFGRLPDGVPFFVMELLVGHTLGEVIKAKGPVPAARAARILRKVAAALAAAHAAGVVHRDLKPDNVFLVGGSRDVSPFGLADDPDRARSLALLSYAADVRVVDFGAAKIVGSSRVTRAGVVFGTPHYMSPEQASGQELDRRADVYSLGVIMYEMFTGRVPFEADTYMGVLTQHMFVQPVPPSQTAGSTPELGELESITLKCLEKSRDDRFASMDDVVVAIDQVVRQRGDDGTPPTPSSAWAAPHRPSVYPGGEGGRGSSSLPYAPALADTSGLPTFDDVRAALAKGSNPPSLPYARAARRLLAITVVGASAAAAVLAFWPRSREADQTPAAAEAARPLDAAPSSNVAAPWMPAAGGSMPPVGTSGRGAPAPAASASARNPAPTTSGVTGAGETGVGAHRSGDAIPAASVPIRDRPHSSTPIGDIDDVGDPFATKH